MKRHFSPMRLLQITRVDAFTHKRQLAFCSVQVNEANRLPVTSAVVENLLLAGWSTKVAGAVTQASGREEGSPIGAESSIRGYR
jgi:hypothetical protein